MKKYMQMSMHRNFTLSTISAYLKINPMANSNDNDACQKVSENIFKNRSKIFQSLQNFQFKSK